MNLLLHGLRRRESSPATARRGAARDRRPGPRRRDPHEPAVRWRGRARHPVELPEDKQTAETALLFLQLIMRKLKRAPKPGRAAVVVPNGVLFGDNIAARASKRELLRDFNLHTIVRLPNGVFAPYTDIPSNLVFFDRRGPDADHLVPLSCPCPQGARNTARPRPFSSRSSRLPGPGGRSVREGRRAGRSPLRTLPPRGLQPRPQESERQDRTFTPNRKIRRVDART